MRGGPKLPKLPYGDGSLTWDAKRGRVVLRHRMDGKTFTERATTVAGAIVKRDERRVGFGIGGTTLVRMPVEVAARLERVSTKQEMSCGALVNTMLDLLRLYGPGDSSPR